jgi:hypothetical protein
MLTTVLYYTGAAGVAAGLAVLVAVLWPRRREPTPDEGLGLVEEAMQPCRPRRYAGTRRAGDRVPIGVPRAVARVYDRPVLIRREYPRWADPRRDTMPVLIYPPPTARGVAKVGGRRG